MKVALCLHGYFNSSKDTTSKGCDGFKHIYNKILKDNDVDIYIHSWDLENQSQIEDLYSIWIKNKVFEPQIDFSHIINENWKNKYTYTQYWNRFKNIFSQFYSIQNSFQLIPKDIKYDICIKSRFDLGRINRSTSGPHNANNPYAVQCINFNSNLDMSKVYMAEWGQKRMKEEGPADMWFYSSYDNMQNFSMLYDIAVRDIRLNSEYTMWAGPLHGGPLNTIKAWKWFFITTGLWNKKQLLKTDWE